MMWPLPSLGPHFLHTYLAYFALVNTSLPAIPLIALTLLCVPGSPLQRGLFSPPELQQHHPSSRGPCLPLYIGLFVCCLPLAQMVSSTKAEDTTHLYRCNTQGRVRHMMVLSKYLIKERSRRPGYDQYGGL